MFRLVTDETVEVKVVERAQQKLKLDAMVVQQGRLQDKEKKMTKQDLLDTLRFGADKIFRSKDSTISDADIDLILEEGKFVFECVNCFTRYCAHNVRCLPRTKRMCLSFVTDFFIHSSIFSAFTQVASVQRR